MFTITRAHACIVNFSVALTLYRNSFQGGQRKKSYTTFTENRHIKVTKNILANTDQWNVLGEDKNIPPATVLWTNASKSHFTERWDPLEGQNVYMCTDPNKIFLLYTFFWALRPCMQSSATEFVQSFRKLWLRIDAVTPNLCPQTDHFYWPSRDCSLWCVMFMTQLCLPLEQRWWLPTACAGPRYRADFHCRERLC